MTAGEFLAAAAASGLRVDLAPGDGLTFDGPRSVVERLLPGLRRRKGELLEELERRELRAEREAIADEPSLLTSGSRTEAPVETFHRARLKALRDPLEEGRVRRWLRAYGMTWPAGDRFWELVHLHRSWPLVGLSPEERAESEHWLRERADRRERRSEKPLVASTLRGRIDAADRPTRSQVHCAATDLH